MEMTAVALIPLYGFFHPIGAVGERLLKRETQSGMGAILVGEKQWLCEVRRGTTRRTTCHHFWERWHYSELPRERAVIFGLFMVPLVCRGVHLFDRDGMFPCFSACRVCTVWYWRAFCFFSCRCRKSGSPVVFSLPRRCGNGARVRLRPHSPGIYQANIMCRFVPSSPQRI